MGSEFRIAEPLLRRTLEYIFRSVPILNSGISVGEVYLLINDLQKLPPIEQPQETPKMKAPVTI
jgi:hypothetical protein